MMKTRRPFSLGNLYASNFTGGYDPREREKSDLSSDTDVINKQLREPYEETLSLTSFSNPDVRSYSSSSNQTSGNIPVETSGNLKGFYNNQPEVEAPSTTDQVTGLAKQAASSYLQNQIGSGLSGLFSSGAADTYGAGLSNIGTGGIDAIASQPFQYGSGAGATTAPASSGYFSGSAGLGLAGALGAYDLFANERGGNRGVAQGAASGAAIGTYILPGWGTLIGAGVGGVAGAFAGGKGKEHRRRDMIRGNLAQAGIVTKAKDGNYVTLADGSTYNIDRDGNSKLVNAAGQARKSYEIDQSDPNAVALAEYAKPMATAFTHGSPNLGENFTGYFVNAALSNAKNLDEAKANLASIYKSSGHKRFELEDSLKQIQKSNKLSPKEFEDYKAKLVELFPSQQITLEGMGENGEEISDVPRQRVYQRGLADLLPKTDIPKPPQQVYNPYNEKKGNLSNYMRTRI